MKEEMVVAIADLDDEEIGVVSPPPEVLGNQTLEVKEVAAVKIHLDYHVTRQILATRQ